MSFTNSTLNGCCRDCKDRYLACHDHCEIYQDALAEWLEQKRRIKAEKRKESEMREYNILQVKRMKTIRRTN